MRTGHPGEVVEAEPEHDRPARTIGPPHPPGHAVDERDEGRVDLGEGSRAASERTLRPDRPAAQPRPHAAAIVVVGERVEVTAGGAPEHRDERVLRELRDLADGPDPAVV